METNTNFMDLLPQETSQSIYMPYLTTNYKASGTTGIQANQTAQVTNGYQEDILASSAGIFPQYNVEQTNTYTTTQDVFQTNNDFNFNIPTTTEAYPVTNYATTNETTNYDFTNNYTTTTEAYPTTDYTNYETTDYANVAEINTFNDNNFLSNYECKY